MCFGSITYSGTLEHKAHIKYKRRKPAAVTICRIGSPALAGVDIEIKRGASQLKFTKPEALSMNLIEGNDMRIFENNINLFS